ncbi:MAG: amidohydrolase family protein, partial [Pseudomonadota bacterium]|nr:amidohydrolase family protein [Pseudomonadota bacterium]
MTMVCLPPSLRLGILGLFACLSFSAQAAEPRLVIHAGGLLDGTGAPLRGPSTVVLDGSRIEAVMPGHQAPAPGDEVLDLRGHTVMPGLIDMHVHLRSESNPRAALDRFRLNPEDHVLRAAKHARTTLNAGFTTVRDLGGAEVLALRDAINGGWAEGPRIFAAGRSIATTGGHADPTNGGRHDIWETPGPTDGVINGTVEARAAVRQRYKDGSDVIKVTATGGVLSQAKNGQNPQFALDELKAIVETAR